MGLGKASQVIISDKPMPELFAATERAMGMIGKITEADPQAGRLRGGTKYGLQRVKLNVEFTQTDAGTQMTVLGSSDDVGGVGASQGVARLLEVLENPDKVQGDTDYLKRGMGKSTALWVLAAFVVLLLLIVLRAWLAVT
jgi:hypothetical protein